MNEMLGNSLNNVYAVKYLFIYRNYACIYTKSCFIMVLRLINMYVCETRFKLYVCLLWLECLSSNFHFLTSKIQHKLLVYKSHIYNQYCFWWMGERRTELVCIENKNHEHLKHSAISGFKRCYRCGHMDILELHHICSCYIQHNQEPELWRKQ